MRTRQIILVSGKAQAGKDTFCNFYVDEASKHKVKAKRVAFADELKEMARTFGWDGSKEGEGRSFLIDLGQILRGDYEYKEGIIWSKITGQPTIRTTYSLSNLYNRVVAKYDPTPDFWVRRAFFKINQSRAKVVIIPDWRFKNEYESLKRMIKWCWPKVSLITVRIDNFRSLHINDPSELDLDQFSCDIFIGNHSNLDTFQNCIRDIYKKIKI